MADLRNTRLSIYLRNYLLNGGGMEAFDGGTIKIYTAAQPATPETAIGAQILLASPQLNAEAFPDNAAAGGSIVANPITSQNAVANGTAAWFRVFDASGLNVLMDGSVGPLGDGNLYNLTLPTVVIPIGMSIGAASFTFTLPMQGT